MDGVAELHEEHQAGGAGGGRGFGEKTPRGAMGVLLSRNGCSVTIDTRKEKHPTATAKSSRRI